LHHCEPIEGRGQRSEIIIKENTDPIILIDESYNASPASMLAAFKVLEMTEPAKDGRRIAILGDMLELGSQGPMRHMDLANPLLKAKIDILFACGHLMEALYQSLPPIWQGAYSATSRDLSKIICDQIHPKDVILIKGSLGSQMAYVIQAIQNMNIKKDIKYAV
jgi:UDP-N-acetylmuramyl pentapeptide synthase